MICGIKNMIVNRLLVFPTQNTLDYFSRIFSGCPFDLDLNQMYVEINSSVQEMTCDTDAIYEATAGTLDIYYDTAINDSSLILPLTSPSLVERCKQVRSYAPTAFYYDKENNREYYFPFLLIKDIAPTKSISYRRFLASISTTLAGNHYPLLFGNEYIVTADFDQIPHQDYYNSVLARLK
jgi:hypothetical protein